MKVVRIILEKSRQKRKRPIRFRWNQSEIIITYLHGLDKPWWNLESYTYQDSIDKTKRKN